MRTTNYYFIKDGALHDVARLFESDVRDAVFTEMQEICAPRPGDDEYTLVYGKEMGKSDIAGLNEPRLEDALALHAERTGRESVSLFQWNAQESTLYCLLRGYRVVVLEDVLGAVPSNEFEAIAEELDGIFISLEDSREPGYVRTASLGRSDLNEDEGHSEELREWLAGEIGDGRESVTLYEWTE